MNESAFRLSVIQQASSCSGVVTNHHTFLGVPNKCTGCCYCYWAQPPSPFPGLIQLTLFQIQFLMKHSPPGSLGPLPRQSAYLLTLMHSVFVECVKNCSGLLRSVPNCPFLQRLVTERFHAPTLITPYLFLPVGLKLVSFKGTLCEVGVGRFPEIMFKQHPEIGVCLSVF